MGRVEQRPEAADRGSRSGALVVLAVLAIIVALYLGRAFLIPIALSILFTGLLRPLVRRLESLYLPAPVAAAVIMVVFLGALATAGTALADPVRGWVARVPQTLRSAQDRLRSLQRSLQQLTDVAERIEKAAAPAAGGSRPGGARAPSGPAGTEAPKVAVRVFGFTWELVAGTVEVLLLTLLLLASGDLFLQKLLKVIPVRGDKRTAVRIAGEVEAAVVRYMVATAAINLGQGLLVGLAMWGLGMPSPGLWAILTLFLEFIPYLGGALLVILLTVTGLATFDGVGHALLAPLAYLVITTLQNNLVSPIAYGRRLRLNPVAVLIGVLFWWSIWGTPGAFLAVPIIATAKIIGDHVDGLAGVGEFLGA